MILKIKYNPVLLDLLAYNTHYLSYHANILSNEMFIDTADLRPSIVSLGSNH